MLAVVLNILAVTASFAALAISTSLSFRQVTYARHANHLPFAAQMLQEWRDPTFVRDEEFVHQQLADDHDSALGISGLPLETKQRVLHVLSFYQSVAALAVFDIVDRDKIVFMLGRRALRSWHALEPFILTERNNASPNVTMYSLFEDLASRASTASNVEMARTLGLRRMGATT
jgi:hypothetical protein